MIGPLTLYIMYMCVLANIYIILFVKGFRSFEKNVSKLARWSMPTQLNNILTKAVLAYVS
jgi:hypothetical protein